MKRAPAIAVLAIAALVVACGAAEGGTTDTTPLPDPDQVILSITSEGGFIPMEMRLDQTPRYVLTADGRLFSQGPIPQIFPGPLLPNIQRTTLSDANFGEVLRLIEDVGFADFDERSNDEAANQVMDAATDVFRYYDANGEHSYSVYALGFVQGGGSDLILLNEIVEILDVAGFSGESQPYQGDRLQVIAGSGIGIMDPQLTTQADWPLEVGLAEMAEWAAGQRCAVLEGEAASAAYEVFDQANQGYVWGPEELSIRARPLFPGEAGCEVPDRLENMPAPTAPPITIAED